jgi:hypothetical protein
MANESTYASISTVINSIWENAFLTVREFSIIQPLVQNFTAVGSHPRSWTEYTGGTIATIAETTDMSAQTFNHASAGTLTPATKGAQYFLTDVRIATDWAAASRDAGTDLGQLLAVGVETDLAGYFDDVTGGTVGSAGGTLSFKNVLEAATRLRAQIAPAPYYCIMRPEQWYHIASATSGVPTFSQSPEFMDSMFRQWYVGAYGGIEFFIDSNITSGTAATGIMFSRSALGFDLRRALRIETQRDASRGGGGYELNATMIYAAGIYRPKFGCQMIGTSSI